MCKDKFSPRGRKQWLNRKQHPETLQPKICGFFSRLAEFSGFRKCCLARASLSVGNVKIEFVVSDKVHVFFLWGDIDLGI